LRADLRGGGGSILRADYHQQIKVHAHGVWPFSAGGKEFVVRSPEDLVAAINGKKGNDAEAKAVAELIKALKGKDIDWKSALATEE